MNITNYLIGFLFAFCVCLLIDIHMIRNEIDKLYCLFNALCKDTDDRFKCLLKEIYDEQNY